MRTPKLGRSGTGSFSSFGTKLFLTFIVETEGISDPNTPAEKRVIKKGGVNIMSQMETMKNEVIPVRNPSSWIKALSSKENNFNY